MKAVPSGELLGPVALFTWRLDMESVKSTVATSPVAKSLAVSSSDAPAELAGSTYQVVVSVPSGLSTRIIHQGIARCRRM